MKVQCHQLSKISYRSAWDYQTFLHNKVIRAKKEKRNDVLNHLIFCEHNPVYTLGKSGNVEHLLDKSDAEFFKINRGGDITYHGPGQLTVYLILDLERIYRDVNRYVRSLEAIVMKLLRIYKIEDSLRIPEFTGVWLKRINSYDKLCAIGVHLSRWVSMHGFALNINTDLKYFNNIIPCGINEVNKSVTSMSAVLKRDLDMDEIVNMLKTLIAEEFNFQYIEYE